MRCPGDVRRRRDPDAQRTLERLPCRPLRSLQSLRPLLRYSYS